MKCSASVTRIDTVIFFSSQLPTIMFAPFSYDLVSCRALAKDLARGVYFHFAAHRSTEIFGFPSVRVGSLPSGSALFLVVAFTW